MTGRHGDLPHFNNLDSALAGIIMPHAAAQRKMIQLKSFLKKLIRLSEECPGALLGNPVDQPEIWISFEIGINLRR